jgi:hypothetical protein
MNSAAKSQAVKRIEDIEGIILSYLPTAIAPTSNITEINPVKRRRTAHVMGTVKVSAQIEEEESDSGSEDEGNDGGEASGTGGNVASGSATS